MKVDLVWTTPNAEEMIVEMARVSSPKNKRNMETAPKLLRYLIEHKHWSPFEMADMCVEINTTRAISPQILRHRSFSFQEFSQRYASVDLLGNSAIPHLRRQDKKNRQNSTNDLHDTLGTTQVASYYRRISQLFEDSEHLYKEMVSAGVAKECARFVLPVASPTTMYMKGSLRSWIHYLEVRCDESTQLEHREIAERIKQIFCHQFPVIGEAAFPKKSTGWLGR